MQISVDDTIAGQLGKNSETAFEQSKLLQFIGMGDELVPHIGQLECTPTDKAVLTTDGVHFLAPANGWLGQIVNNAPDPGLCVKRLVDLAKWCGGPDNATAIVIDISADQEPEEDRPYSCLEVWDTFGELQIVINDNAIEAPSMTLRRSIPTADQTLISRPDNLVGLSKPAENYPKTAERGTSKPRRNKRPHKAKSGTGKREKNAIEGTEVGVPQLLMEFPDKSK